MADSPDGKTILTGVPLDTARLWDAATGQPLGQPLKHRTAISSAAFSPDGKTVLTGSYDRTSKFWDELDIRLLSSKAEAVILYDPVFPADPFAP